MGSERAASRTNEEMTAKEKVEEEVFKQIFIPRTLIEVAHPERDAKAVSANFDDTSQDNKVDKSKLLAPYQAVTGVQLKKTRDENADDSSASESEHSCDESGSDNDEDEGEEGSKGFKDSHRPRDESPNSRKERKKAVKEAQADKRKSKMKKHLKKRKEKAGKASKK